MKLSRLGISKPSVAGRGTPVGSIRSVFSLWTVLGGLTGAVLALLWNMPAQWLAHGLAEVSKGQVQLQEAQGSVWQGSGKLVLTGGAGSRDALALPGRVHWQMNFSGGAGNVPGLNLKVQALCCMTQAAQVHVTPLKAFSVWQFQMDDHRSEWPAHWLTGLGSPWNTLQPEGALVLETKKMVLEFGHPQPQVEGRLSLTALNLSSKLSTLKPMGTYELSLANAAPYTAPNTAPNTQQLTSPQLILTTQSGSLLLSGQGQWQGTHFQFRGEASAVPEHAAALSNLLNIIGRRQGARSLLSLG